MLFRSSKEIYDKASYEGRAEADIIAYATDEDNHQVVKDRTGRVGIRLVYGRQSLGDYIRDIEHKEWNRELEEYKKTMPV